MPNTLTITVPFPPDMRLSDNAQRRLHWGKRATIIREAREEFRYAVLEDRSIGPGIVGWPMFTGEITVSWRVMFGDKRHRDYENVVAALKVYLDILCPDAAHTGGLGIIQNDHSGIIKRYEVEIVEPDGCPGWTTLTITEAA